MIYSPYDMTLSNDYNSNLCQNIVVTQRLIVCMPRLSSTFKLCNNFLAEQWAIYDQNLVP